MANNKPNKLHPALPSHPREARSRSEEPRGRPSGLRPRLSGSSPQDPLIPCQVLKVRKSIWRALAEAAAEKKWHRSVLVRDILEKFVEERKRTRAAGNDKAT